MLYRRMPKTGDRISILVSVHMRFLLKMEKIDREKAKRQVRYAIDHE